MMRPTPLPTLHGCGIHTTTRPGHLAPDGRTRHTGPRRDCPEACCINDADDAVALTPDELRDLGLEWHPRATPQRGNNGQEAS